MKTLILVLLLSVITLTCTAQTISNKSIYNVDTFIKDCLVELKVTDSVNVILMSNIKIKSCTVVAPNLKNTYIIFISNNVAYNDYITILAHEIVHVKQFVNNEIAFTTVARYDAVYDAKYKYDIKFENEANIIGKDLINKHLKFKL